MLNIFSISNLCPLPLHSWPVPPPIQAGLQNKWQYIDIEGCSIQEIVSFQIYPLSRQVDNSRINLQIYKYCKTSIFSTKYKFSNRNLLYLEQKLFLLHDTCFLKTRVTFYILQPRQFSLLSVTFPTFFHFHYFFHFPYFLSNFHYFFSFSLLSFT